MPDYLERYDYYNYQNRRELRQLLFGVPPQRLHQLCQAIHPWVAEDALLYHLGSRPSRQEHRDALRHFLSLDPERPLGIFVPILERSPYDRVRVADWDLLGRLYDDRFTYRELDIATFGEHLVEVALVAAVRLLPHVDDPSTGERLQRWLRRARAIDATLVEQALSQPRFAALMPFGDAVR